MTPRRLLRNPRRPLSTRFVSSASFCSLIPATWRHTSFPCFFYWSKAVYFISTDCFTRHHALTRLPREKPGLSTVTHFLSSKWDTFKNVIVSEPVKDLSQCVIDNRSWRMWGMWQQAVLSWMWLIIELPCRSARSYFTLWIKDQIQKDFSVSFTSDEALTIQFFAVLRSWNGNLPCGKAGVRRGINTHRGHVQGWFVLEKICIMYR